MQFIGVLSTTADRNEFQKEKNFFGISLAGTHSIKEGNRSAPRFVANATVQLKI